MKAGSVGGVPSTLVLLGHALVDRLGYPLLANVISPACHEAVLSAYLTRCPKFPLLPSLLPAHPLLP